MGLLDDLKAKSELRKTEELAERRHAEQLQAAYERYVNPKMRQIFKYLSQLVEEVNYLKPKTRVDFELPVYGRMLGLRQDEYRLTVDSLESMRQIVLRFRCTGGQTARFKVSPPSVASDLRDQLLEHAMKFDSRDYFDDYRAVIGQRFQVEGEIPVMVRVAADIERTLIHIHITNFDAPISRHAKYRPEQITPEFLDDLGNYILRKHTKLIQLPISEEERKELRQRMELEAKRRQGGLVTSLLGRSQD
jgi:hypothetical protein